MKILIEYLVIAAIVLFVMFASIIIPMKCQAFEVLPDPKAYIDSPTISAELHAKAQQARALRALHPDLEYRIHVWQSPEDMSFVFKLLMIKTTKHVGGTFFVMRFADDGLTPHEYAKKTGRWLDFTLGLTDYEWYFSRKDV